MMAQNEPHSDARTVLVSDAEDFHHETQFIETLRLILREDHTRIVDDTLYEKVLDWMLRCVTLDPVNRIRARDGYQLSPKFPSDFAGHEEILRMIGSGLQQKESRVVAVMLKLCGHLCSLGDAAFKMVHDGPLDALNIALRLTNHAEPRIRTAAYECLTLAASFAGHHADSATPRNNKHTPDATQCRTTQVDVNAHESARRSVEWCAHEEESLFECVAASLSDRSIYVQLQGRTLLVNVLNACQDTPRLLAKIWQDGSPMYDEITRVLDDAPAFSYERKKAIADMVLAVCLAVQDSVPLDLGSDAQSRHNGGCAIFLEKTALPLLVWTKLSVDTDPRLRVQALDIAAACLARLCNGQLGPHVLMRNTPVCTPICIENASMAADKSVHRECTCATDAVMSSLVLSVLPFCLENTAFIHIPVRVAALQCPQGDESDLSRQLLRLASDSLCAELEAASQIQSPTPTPTQRENNASIESLTFRLVECTSSMTSVPKQTRANEQLCTDWLKEFRRTLSLADAQGSSVLSGTGFSVRREVMGMTADKKLVAAIVPPLIQHWCPKPAPARKQTHARVKPNTYNHVKAHSPNRACIQGDKDMSEWQCRLTASLLASITQRNPKRLTIRHRRFVLNAASAVVATSCYCPAANAYVPNICTSVLSMLEDPSLDTTLIKDTLAVTRAYLSRVCVCACSQGGTCMCVCVSTPQEKVIVDTWARLLYDPRWEVRDSVVECLHGTIKDAHTEARKATSIRREYLCHRQSDVLSADDDIPFIDGKARIGFEHPASRYAKFVSALKTSSAVHGMWRACTDKDAYVRSSSMRAMCDLLAFEPTRVILQTYFADDQNLYADTCSKRDPIASQVAHKTHEVVPIPPHLTEKDRNRMLDAYFADKEMTPIIPGMVPVLDKIDNEEVNVREDQKARTMDEIAKQNTRLSPPSNGHSQASIDEYDTTHELYHSRMVVCQSVEFIRVILSICKMARARVRTDPEAFCRRAAIELLDGILTSYACCCTPELSQLAGCLYRAGDSDPDTEVRTRAIHLMLSLIPEEKLHCFNQAHDFTMNGAPVDHVEYGALAGGRMNGSHEISDDIVNSSSLSDLSVGVQPPSRHGACIRARIELFKMSKAASLIQRFETEEPAVRQSVAYQLRQLLYSKTAADNEQETNMGTDITVPSCVTSVDCKPDDSKPSARPTSADVSLDGCLRWLSDGSCLAALKRETVRGELLLRDQISPLVIFKPVLDMQENAMDCYN